MATKNPLQSITLTSSATSVTFYNVDQSYLDLDVVITARSNVAATTDSYLMQFNGDTGNNYSRTRLFGNGSTATAAGRSTAPNIDFEGLTGASSPTGAYGTATVSLLSYTAGPSKSVLIKGSDAGSYVLATNGLWRGSSAPITSITFSTSSGSGFAAGSTFDLYGVSPAAAKVAAASGGTDIAYDSSYVYHVFKGSGIFTPNRALTADVLVIGGGGGGGAAAGGGGGAGGLCWQSGRSLTAGTAYTVTIGSGGSGGWSDGQSGKDGANSTFDTITALGGGGGNHGSSGAAGGSGGGAGYTTGSGGAATQGTSGGATGYGNAGGNQTRSGSGSPYPSAGGGGAGGAGGNAIESAAGNGGVGLTYTTISALDAIGAATNTGELSSSHYYYAGGGGGSREASGWGSGGLGGGGRGGTVLTGGITYAPVPGSMNTGGGGGGGIQSGLYSLNVLNGVSGGSGLVIVRYAR